MTELAVHQNNTPAVVPSPAAPEPSSDLLVWAQEARQAASIATSLASTSFVPATMRGNPENVTAAILAGHELGLRPMASLRSMDIIQGTPALRAHAMRGLVQSHGHSVQVQESTETRCVVRGRRRGEDAWQTVTWTIERAERMGLTTKGEWRKQPQTMLVARATGEVCRLIASDVLFAMPYASEEIDGVEESGPAPRVTAAEILRQPASEPMPADVSRTPEIGPVDDSVPLAPAARMATRDQLTKLHATLNDFGVQERTEKLQTVGLLAGRVLESSSDLTLNEASQVIDRLDDLLRQDNPAAALDLVLAELANANADAEARP